MTLARDGYDVDRGFLPVAECEALLAAIAGYRERREPPLIVRPQKGRSLRYRVIDGHAVRDQLGELERLYAVVHRRAERRSGRDLVPLADPLARLNVNITPPGGEYRWHYDRNAVTGVLYLNQVAGGEIELYPRYRLPLGRRAPGQLQYAADRLLQAGTVRAALGRRVTIAPEQGMLLLMRADRCLHSVAEVRGAIDRICVVMAFDTLGGHATRPALGAYLYTQDSTGRGDPNYRPRE